jgi:mannose-6-phosphate isomerase-like protein (cupin superfamily)
LDALAIIEKDNVLAVVADEEAHWTAVPGEGFVLRRIVLKRGNVWIVPIAYRFRKRGRRFSPSQLGEIYSPPSGSMHE